MDQSNYEIPPPRGEQFRFFGLRPTTEDLQWIMDAIGLEKFKEELETDLNSLIWRDFINNWRRLLATREGLAREIRAKVYGLLAGKISKTRFQELVEDKYEFEKDTFLALLDSHARYFLILIPEVGRIVRQYDVLIESFDQANSQFTGILHRQFPKMTHEPDARRILIRLTLQRLKGGDTQGG